MAKKEKPVTLDTKPIFEPGETGIEDFEYRITATVDGAEENITLLGTAAVTDDGGRFIYFEPLAPNGTAEGAVQRELAKHNKMFIVDEIKISRLKEQQDEKGSDNGKN